MTKDWGSLSQQMKMKALLGKFLKENPDYTASGPLASPLPTRRVLRQYGNKTSSTVSRKRVPSEKFSENKNKTSPSATQKRIVSEKLSEKGVNQPVPTLTIPRDESTTTLPQNLLAVRYNPPVPLSRQPVPYFEQTIASPHLDPSTGDSVPELESEDALNPRSGSHHPSLPSYPRKQVARLLVAAPKSSSTPFAILNATPFASSAVLPAERASYPSNLRRPARVPDSNTRTRRSNPNRPKRRRRPALSQLPPSPSVRSQGSPTKPRGLPNQSSGSQNTSSLALQVHNPPALHYISQYALMVAGSCPYFQPPGAPAEHVAEERSPTSKPKR